MMRFGVVVGAPDREAYIAAVRRVEAQGFDVVYSSDHLHLSGRHATWFTPIPALAVAASATERIRIGTAVLNQDLRHPAVLARDAASLDVLSDGRLELGLGAGWNEAEYAMAGLRFDPVGVRIRRFIEYVRVVKGVLAAREGGFSFEGEFYTVHDMPAEPVPVQSPVPPILIGATEPRMLALAAREADIVSINLPRADDPGDEGLASRVALVREAAEDRFGRIELQLPLAAVLLTDGSATAAIEAAVGQPGQFLLTMLVRRFGIERVAGSPMVLAGSPATIADRLARLEQEQGIGSVMVPMALADALVEVLTSD